MVTAAEKIHTRIQTENQLLEIKLGFSAAFMGVQYLESHIQKYSDTITKKTIQVLLQLIQSRRFEKKKQSYFLYKQAAFAIVHISKDHTHFLAGFSITNLQDILLSCTGSKHRAVSEALGSLPLKINGPKISSWDTKTILTVSFNRLLENCHQHKIKKYKWQGRTLVFSMQDKKKGCIKFIKKGESPNSLAMEINWLNYLIHHPINSDIFFDIPVPVTIEKKNVFKLTNLPDWIIDQPVISTECIAICFIAHETYFHYPNEPKFLENSKDSILDIFARNAWLLGKLTSKGIIHTALIPLFHNRAQQSRRQDQGRYNWEQGGRLDQWLESSKYPNFATSGLRDFEHMISIPETKDLRHFIGEHILSFILVAGSFFRNKAPGQSGLDPNGFPLDMRYLFDITLFSDLIKIIIHQYYLGITGFELKRIDHLLKADLIQGLVQAMGVDLHMEETLRIQDQENMSENEFNSFLKTRGIDHDQIRFMVKAKEDIILQTGPHLGGFNQAISVPELIDFLFCLSSLCVSDRYLMENGLKAYLN
ncbi:MAG: SidJ-related pseudokinase [Pseudomonadota bacterium]